MTPEARPSDGAVRVRAVVSGRVQGVWYRDSCRREAARLGVGGWVRNLPDGRVEIEAEGARDRVEALLAWARQGPPLARVTGLDIEDLPPTGERTFSVR
ncbi:MAG TPA: acylphosphatase [Acidimicrobiales bacterium]